MPSDHLDNGALFARAIQLAGNASTRDSDEYWRLIRLLHRRPEREVCEKATAYCTAGAAVERRVGADVLAQLGSADARGLRPFTPETVAVLRRLLSDNSDDVIAAAVHALAHHHHAAVGELRELAHHPSQLIREAVAHALTGHDDGEAIALLMELMTDVDDAVRDWATFAIGSQCDADGRDLRQALVDRLADSDEEIRGEAMVGLARRRDLAVVELRRTGARRRQAWAVGF